MAFTKDITAMVLHGKSFVFTSSLQGFCQAVTALNIVTSSNTTEGGLRETQELKQEAHVRSLMRRGRERDTETVREREVRNANE